MRTELAGQRTACSHGDQTVWCCVPFSFHSRMWSTRMQKVLTSQHSSSKAAIFWATWNVCFYFDRMKLKPDVVEFSPLYRENKIQTHERIKRTLVYFKTQRSMGIIRRKLLCQATEQRFNLNALVCLCPVCEITPRISCSCLFVFVLFFIFVFLTRISRHNLQGTPQLY